MSSFAFSHQFSERWLATPDPVKQTIIQELDDIVTLLQPETDFDSYQFTVHNLHDSVEQLMAIEAIRQERIRAEARRLEKERLEKERLEAERLEQQRLADEMLKQQELEKERLKRERLEREQLEQQRLEQDRIEIEQLQKERAIAKKSSKKKDSTTQTPKIAQPRLAHDETIAETAAEMADDPTKATSNEAIVAVTVERHSHEMVYAIDHRQADDRTLHDNPIQPDQDSVSINSQAIVQQIREPLQRHIDAYLQEIKAELYQWLDDEVNRQVDEQLKTQ